MSHHLSIVSPIYQAESMIDILVEQIEQHVRSVTLDYEIILVEDGSKDASWDKIVEITKFNKKVKGVKLSKNFGQHKAIYAGLEIANGDWVVVMDCDLQDHPENIPALYMKAKEENIDIVFARRQDRKDRFFKKITSKYFYKVLGYLADIRIDPTVANFGLYNRVVIEEVLRFKEPYFVFSIMVNLVGFSKGVLDVKHYKRIAGKSTYDVGKRLSLAVEIILSNTDKPIRIMMKAGFLISGSSILMAIYTLIQYLSGKITQPGFTSIMISIWFLSGVIISFIGLCGLYIGKIFEGVKQRPMFIVQTITNADDQKK